jgi:poly [ADP-ribose] polymerase
MSALKTIIVKGKIPVDEYCSIKDTVHVYDDGKPWDACLNQTDIAKNNNKFYNIQLLEADASKTYYLWVRYGRIGERGRSTLSNGLDLNSGKMDFSSKFHDKTKNTWPITTFKSYSGKYTLLERDYGVSDSKISPEVKIAESKLDTKVADLVKLVCDTNMMKSAMMKIGYDANKMPLGKLSSTHIKHGYEVLKKLETAIANKSDIQVLEEFRT